MSKKTKKRPLKYTQNRKFIGNATEEELLQEVEKRLDEKHDDLSRKLEQKKSDLEDMQNSIEEAEYALDCI